MNLIVAAIFHKQQTVNVFHNLFLHGHKLHFLQTSITQTSIACINSKKKCLIIHINNFSYISLKLRLLFKKNMRSPRQL